MNVLTEVLVGGLSGKGAGEVVANAGAPFVFKAIGDLAQSKTKPYADAELLAMSIAGQLKTETDPAKREALLETLNQADATMLQFKGQYDDWKDGSAYKSGLHAAANAILSKVGGADALKGFVAGGANEAMSPLVAELSKGLEPAGKKFVADLGSLLVGAAIGNTQTAGLTLAAELNNRQLHPREAQLIKDNAARYANRYGMSVERAEAELAQQAMQQTDSAWDTRFGPDNNRAQAFLKELGSNQLYKDPKGGESFPLFVANEVDKDNHVIFSQYVKESPDVKRELDLAMAAVYKPLGAQNLDRRGMSGSDMAINDAARDYGSMIKQPLAVQKAVLSDLRNTCWRRSNIDPPRRSKFDPGRDAAFLSSSCG